MGGVLNIWTKFDVKNSNSMMADGKNHRDHMEGRLSQGRISQGDSSKLGKVIKPGQGRKNKLASKIGAIEG